ncbi:MAG: ribonuclease D [Pseudomonadota bacterium]
MQFVTEQDKLTAACDLLAEAEYITIDTEFMRERTYWPKLCLVQVARQAGPWGEEAVFLIDPLVGLDLAPLFDLMANEKVLKVFHAARQDIEIFVNLTGAVPKPIFDTQVAAMVCGYGDQAGYETLVKKIAKAQLDKSSRFTDWSRRPLSDKQLRYAAGDVTHLRIVYESLAKRLQSSGREGWVSAEMEILNDRGTYIVEPSEAWRRVKTRSSEPRFLAMVRELAAWREEEAQSRDVPRGRIIKDDALLEIAANRPETRDQLFALRSLQREGRKAETSDAILATVERGRTAPPIHIDKPRQTRSPQPGAQALADLLKVLLKAKADELKVAQRLIASTAELELLAQGELDGLKALEGWRYEAFGETALRLIRGEIALAGGRRGVETIEIKASEPALD